MKERESERKRERKRERERERERERREVGMKRLDNYYSVLVIYII